MPLTINDEGLLDNFPMLEALEFEDADIVNVSKTICIYKSNFVNESLCQRKILV